MPTPSILSDEFSRVIRSHVESAADNKDREEKKQRSKKANTSTIISQHKAASCGGGESTGPPQSSSSSSSTNTTSTPSVSADSTSKVEDLLNAPMPKTPDEAIDRINKLSAMRDDLLAEQDRNNKFVERYKAKVDKQERMATLRNIIPRQLFVREDRYNEEIEKVYKWSGISDQDIADIYRRKLGDIRQHSASSTITRDPYQNFKDVPDFSKVNGKPMSSYSSSTASEVMRNLEFMKKIAGGGGNN